MITIQIHWAVLAIGCLHIITTIADFAANYRFRSFRENTLNVALHLFFTSLLVLAEYMIFPMLIFIRDYIIVEIRFYYRFYCTTYFEKLVSGEHPTYSARNERGGFLENVNHFADLWGRESISGKIFDRHRKALNKRFNYQPKNNL